LPTQQPESKLQITERALIQRINRRLREGGAQLRTARTPQVETSVGHHFIVDLNCDAITTQNVDLEVLGRELGVIHPWEELANA
jgi:hypothetical protein